MKSFHERQEGPLGRGLRIGRRAIMLAGVAAALAGMGAGHSAHATTTFYLSEGKESSGDMIWQAAVGGVFMEFDFDGYADGSAVDSLPAGPVTVDVGLGGSGGTADSAEVFRGSYGGGGGQYGTVYGGALLNREPPDRSCSYGRIVFTFSEPVPGFGAWVFDNAKLFEDSFRMVVMEAGGTEEIFSDVLESGNGKPHAVEGFIGVVSDVGISSAAIEIVEMENGEWQPQADPRCFEVDHIQVAIPEPLTMLGVFLGLAGLGAYIRRRRIG